MSDVKCSTVLFRTAERDITTFRFMGGSDEYTPYVVEFRYVGVGSDSDPIDQKGALAHVETLGGQAGRALEEAEGR